LTCAMVQVISKKSLDKKYKEAQSSGFKELG
jgi:hypothetical protein